MLLGVVDAVAEARLHAAGYRQRWVRTEVGRMRAIEARAAGAGPPLVMLHGVGSRASDLGPLLHRLRGDAPHVVAPDLPGHGRSARPPGGMDPTVLQDAVFALLDAVVPAGAVVFGNSLGGLVAVRYALHRPERVRALVLASPAGAPMSADELVRFLARFEVDDPRVARDFVDSTFHRAPAPMPLMRPGLRARLLDPSVRDLFSRIRSTDLLTAEDLSAVRAPTVLVWGDAEGLLPSTALPFFESNLGGAVHTVRLARAGHAPYVEAPGAVAEILRETLLQVDSGQLV
jgi:pimeloyl-ACP methyl ester carboxylesterase